MTGRGGRARAKRVFLRVVFSLALLFAVIFAAARRSTALNPYYDDYIKLSSRPMSMGRAGVALSDGPSAIFYNPAGLASQHRYALMHNHSSRHMPASVVPIEVDQLDGDTQAVIVPLSPYLTVGIGFNFQGEMGYDYRPLSELGEFPMERYAAVERLEGLGFALSPWTELGAARRSFFHNYERPPGNIDDETWVILFPDVSAKDIQLPPSYPADLYPYQDELLWSRVGDGYILGLKQMVVPGVTFGWTKERIDFDYSDGYSGRFKRSVKGWAVRPAAWLTLVFDTEEASYFWRKPSMMPVGYLEEKSIMREFSGVEINFAGLAKLRCGSLAGSRTWGFEWTLGNLRLFYTEVKDYLGEVTGAALTQMKDVYFYGFVLTLP